MDLYLHPEAQYACQNKPTRDAALEFVDFHAGLVHDQSRVRGEVPNGDRDPLDDVLVHRVDVVFQLRGDRNDGRRLCNRAWEEEEQNERGERDIE